MTDEGGFQGAQHAAAKEFVALGLANKGDFQTTKTGEIKGLKSGRHVAGYQLAQSDPDQWVYQYLLPALRAHGYNTLDAQIGEIRRLIPNGRAADVVTKFIQQQQSYQNHAQLYGAASGFDALGNGDVFVAIDRFGKSLASFAGVLTSPAMPLAEKALSGLAGWIGPLTESLAALQKNHPLAATVAGAGALAGGLGVGGTLTYNLLSGLLGGFGLKGSAAALDGSAAALSAAAAKLAGGGIVDDVANAANGKGWPGKAGAGVFRADARIDNGLVKFQPDWPAAEHVDANVSFVADGFTVDGRARLGGVQATALKGGIARFGTAELKIDADTAGDAREYLALLSSSPLHKTYGEVMDNLRAAGPAKADFHMLLALADGEKHGYGIMRAVEEETQGQMQIRTGSLYGSIRRMIEAGLIEETNERPDPELDDERRRYYGLTDFGRRVLTAESARIARAMAVIQGKHILGRV